jgi:hypothetical protein
MKRILPLVPLTLLALLAPALLCAAESKQLFNGKDTAGWRFTGPGSFTVEQGLLTTHGGMGLLVYDKEPFGNAVIKVVYKVTGEHDNSGIYIRMPEPAPDPWYGVHNGYEVQIDGGQDDWHCTGAIYSLSKAEQRPQKSKGEWNVIEIELRGQTTIVRVNGVKVNEFRGDQPVPPRKKWFEPVRGPRPDVGYIGLQNHDEGSHVFFKEISVSPLP